MTVSIIYNVVINSENPPVHVINNAYYKKLPVHVINNDKLLITSSTDLWNCRLANCNIILFNLKDMAESTRGMFGGKNFTAPPAFPEFLTISPHPDHNIRTVKDTMEGR